MEQITSLKQVVSFWPSIKDFAQAVSTKDDPVPESRIYQWMRLGRIPKGNHPQILIAAIRRGVKINQLDLDRINETRRNPK